MSIKKLIHPEYFQGNKKKNNYFEGWYYKFVSTNENDTIAFIPGISINQQDPHAFIQVFISHREDDDIRLRTHYIRFKMEDFSFGHDTFFVQIGKNYFSKHRVDIDIEEKQLSISGTLEINKTTPIKKSLISPNIMGVFGYLNFMECYHGVVSMSHELQGSLRIQQETIVFNQGKGYIEKDWGKSFPRAYVWLQSNHFKDHTTSFMFSYADIPFLGFYFKGLIANLLIQGIEYRFATYNRSSVKLEHIDDGFVHYILKKRRYVLHIKAHSTTHIELASPKNGMMIDRIKEGLSGQIEIKLFYKKQLIYEDLGLHAGIEIMKKAV